MYISIQIYKLDLGIFLNLYKVMLLCYYYRVFMYSIQIYELSMYKNLRAAVCDHKKLQEFLMFNNELTARTVSQIFCALDDNVTPNITNKILSNVNVSAILHIVRLRLSLVQPQINYHLVYR